MDANLKEIMAEVYDKCFLNITDFLVEPESKEYDACRFKLNGLYTLCRNAKITPKKQGQFVTFWKRNEYGTIIPFDDTDKIDFYVVNVRTGNLFGQFVFPKMELIEQGIISTGQREGKRAFRVYPPWDTAKSKQAVRIQKWQSGFFYTIDNLLDLNRVKGLYEVEKNSHNKACND